MEGAVRSYLTAGIGVVGASAIALAPVSPIAPADLQAAAAAASSQVQLTASVNPLEVYLDLLQTTGGNIGALVERVLESPAPILQQVLLNQLAIAEELLPALEAAGGAFFENLQTIAAPALQDAFEAIGAGNFNAAASGFVTALFQPALFAALPLLPALQTAIQAPVQNMLAVTEQFQTIAALGALGLLAPFSSSIYATGEALQNIADAASAGDLIGVAAAFIAAPGVVINGFLNGFGVDGGLLSSGLGTFGALLQIRDMIAAAITPPAAPAALAEATDLPAQDAVTLAVSTSTDEAAGDPGGAGSGAVDAENADEVDNTATDETEEAEDAEDAAEDAEDAEDSAEEEAAEEEAAGDDVTEDDLSDDADAADDADDPAGGTDAGDGDSADSDSAQDSDDTGSGDGGSDDSGSNDGGSDNDSGGSDSGGDSE